MEEHCFICASSLSSPLDAEQVKRLQHLLEVEGPLLEAVHLCHPCNSKLLKIEELLAELKKIYSSNREDRVDEGKNEVGNIKEEDGAQKEGASALVDHGYGSTVDQQKFSCGCGAAFLTLDELDVHRRDNHGGGYVCRECGRTLSTTEELATHTAEHRKSLEEIRCPTCTCACNSEHALILHQHLSKTCRARASAQVSVLGESPICGCGLEFKSMELLKSHRDEKHEGLLICPACDRSFRTKQHLIRHHDSHIRPRRRGRPRTTPEIKPKVTGSRKSARTPKKPKKEEYNEEEWNSADEDNKGDQAKEEEEMMEQVSVPKATSSAILAGSAKNSNDSGVESTQATHSDSLLKSDNEETVEGQKFRCPVCDVVYHSERFQRKHIETFHWKTSPEADNEYNCTSCNERSFSVRDIATHGRTHRKKMRKCRSCPAMFPSKKLRRDHYNDFHKGRDGERLVCEQCEEVQETSSGLSYHMLIEHEDYSMLGIPADNKDWLYQCPECRRKFHSFKGFQRHSDFCKGPDNKERLCNICGAVYLSEGAFLLHVANHSGGGQFECDICNKKFVRKRQLKVHKEQHTRPYMCPQCGKRFSELQYMKVSRVKSPKKKAESSKPVKKVSSGRRGRPRIIRSVQPAEDNARWEEDASKLPCIICDSLYKGQVSLRRHMEKVHWRSLSDTEHQCLSCKETFSSLKDIAPHSRAHGEDMPSHCIRCNAMFPNRALLREHIAQEHRRPSAVPEVYTCEDCGEKCDTRGDLGYHELMAHGKDMFHSYECASCKKRFTSLRGHKSHMEVCQGVQTKEFLCNICGCKYLTKNSFNLHMANHSGDFKVECDICHKKFVTKVQLNVHKRRHTKPFMCTQCGKRFAALGHLQDHQLTHSSELNEVCELCQDRFRWRLSLARHRWKAHGVGKPPAKSHKKMMCLLCNSNVFSGSRSRHFKRHHKDIVYSRSYFVVISPNPEDAASKLGRPGIPLNRRKDRPPGEKMDPKLMDIPGVRILEAPDVIQAPAVATVEMRVIEEAAALEPLAVAVKEITGDTGTHHTFTVVKDIGPGQTVEIMASGPQAGGQITTVDITGMQHQLTTQDGIVTPVSGQLTAVQAHMVPVTTHLSSAVTYATSQLNPPVSQQMTNVGEIPTVTTQLSAAEPHMTQVTTQHVTAQLTPVTAQMTPVTGQLTPVTGQLTPATAHLTPVTAQMSQTTAELDMAAQNNVHIIAPLVAASAQESSYQAAGHQQQAYTQPQDVYNTWNMPLHNWQ